MSERCNNVLLILFLMLGSITHSLAFSGPKQYRFTVLNIDDGLSHDQVNCFFKDSRGYIWIGTAFGLNRFDGYNLKVFLHDPKDSSSIKGNGINKIFEDPRGYIWVETWQGYSLYDPATEMFTDAWKDFLKPYNLHGAEIEEIFKDKNGNYWFMETGYGLTLYKPGSKKSFNFQHTPSNSASISSNNVKAIRQTNGGDYWLLHNNGMLDKLDGNTLQVVERNTYFFEKYQQKLLHYEMEIDSDDDLWVYPTSQPGGVFYYKEKEKAFYHFHKDAPQYRLTTNLVKGIVEESAGKIWIGTDLGGIHIINKGDFSISKILHNPDEKNSLVHNSIYSLYKDDEGVIWVGAYKNGLNYFHKNIFRFPHFKKFVTDPESLPYEDVNCFAEDDKGNLWIGTNGGGLLYFNRATKKFTQYKHDPENPNSISSDVIVSLKTDRHNTLWVGTYMGGLNKFDGKKFVRYGKGAINTNSISSNHVWEIFEDSKGNLWIGTIDSGLNFFDPKKEKFRHFNLYDNKSFLYNGYISTITEDKHGNIWIGGTEGIDVINPNTGNIKHYRHSSENPESLISNNVFYIKKDSRNNIWIGTSEGLCLFNEKEGSFRHFTTKDGLPHNFVLTILEDHHHNLWLSTRDGISNVLLGDKGGNKLSVVFKNYDEQDGLQSRAFNENAALEMRSGELVFGGAKGFNVFNPADLESNQQMYEVVFTDFQLFNKSIEKGKKINGRIILPQPLSCTEQVILKHNENLFSIEFSALSCIQPDKIKYKYKLEGFDRQWHMADHQSRRVSYTNLDPGEYVFKVLASNNEGLWNHKASLMKITVLAPFWKTKAAYTVYVALGFCALFLSRRIMLRRERMKFRLEQERSEVKQLHELNLMKINFFTNVSHEFRTPLALILAPLEKLLAQANTEEYQKQYQLMHRNAKRLLNLVNQLLDFRRLEVGGINFCPSEGDVIKFIEDSVQSFKDLSEKKGILLSFHTNTKELHVSFDMDKLEKVLFNLLSNAYKFTRENGKIDVEVTCYSDDASSEELKVLEIKVTDNGIGIPEDVQAKVFQRFFRNNVPENLLNPGSGIGLSISKEFVEMHGGTITLKSAPGEGSCFTVCLPVKELTSVALEKRKDVTAERKEITEHLASGKDKKAVVLLVEDNEDIRFYLKDRLSIYFTIEEAKNGKEGWLKALSVMPDLIVSDLMMPEMNGIDFCKKVKKDARTSHIPFVLLTAYCTEDRKIKSLKIGANDYISKPFNFEVLLSRIQNLIWQRQFFQQVFEKKISIETSEVAITSLDDKFIQNAIRIVEENMGNPDFSVEVLSRELGMSRANLYKKLLALTSKSPVEFIRKIRLQRAAQYLEKSQLSVSEVAYKVGFNNAKYFSKYFKEEFNILPSQYADSKQIQ